MTRLITLLTITLLTGMLACTNKSYDKLYPAGTNTSCDTTRTISYATDIAPIIQANCYGAGNSCHNTGGVSNFPYTTYEGLMVNVSDGALLNDINFTPLRGNSNMPKDGSKLPQCHINLITKWINEGAPNN